MMQDENEEMGRDLAEGHVHALERQLALAKAALEDMRRAYLQLEDVTQQLDNEAEDLQAQVCIEQLLPCHAVLPY
jgi:hypothetical protein